MFVLGGRNAEVRQQCAGDRTREFGSVRSSEVQMSGPYAGGVRGVPTKLPFSLWDMSQSECTKSAIALMSNA